MVPVEYFVRPRDDGVDDPGTRVFAGLIEVVEPVERLELALAILCEAQGPWSSWSVCQAYLGGFVPRAIALTLYGCRPRSKPGG